MCKQNAYIYYLALGKILGNNPVRYCSKQKEKKIIIQLYKGHLKRETESLIIASLNKSFEQSMSKQKQKKNNSKCWLCGEKDEIINPIRSERSKLAWKEYKSRHNWRVTVICWCKWMEFDHVNKLPQQITNLY